MFDRRRFLATSAAVTLPSMIPALARAEKPWPGARTIRVIIPYVAGGVSDSVGRRLIEQVAQVLGQSMIVENKGGAGGTVGVGEVARAGCTDPAGPPASGTVSGAAFVLPLPNYHQADVISRASDVMAQCAATYGPAPALAAE